VEKEMSVDMQSEISKIDRHEIFKRIGKIEREIKGSRVYQ